MADLETLLGGLPAALERLNTTNARAADDAKLAQDNALAEARANHRETHDRRTAEGRANVEALRRIEEDIEQQLEAAAEREGSTAGQALALKKELEEQGHKAEDSKEFQKLNYKAQKEGLEHRLSQPGLTPAARKEIKEEKRKLAKESGSRLDKIGAGIGGLLEMGKKSFKAAALGGIALLSTLAIGGLLIALGKFLQSDTFKKITKYIKEVIIPKITEFWEFLKEWWEPIVATLGVVVTTLTGLGIIALYRKIKAGYIALKAATIKHVLDPLIKSAFGQKVIELFKKMWLAIKVGYAALKAKTILHVLDPLKAAALGVGAKIWSFMKLIPPALVALKVFFLSTFLPAVTAFMVPLLPFIAIAAAIGVALYALWNAFEDFCETLNKTGSIGEALKVGIAKFMGTILGFIPMLVLKLVSWVAGLFGFDDFAAKVDAIDPIQWISDTIKGMFDCIHEWFGQLFTDPVGAIVSLVGGYLSIFTDFGGWVYRKALKPAIDWIGGLFGVTDASGGLEKWVGDKIKILKDFGGWLYEKAIKPAIDWISGMFSWAAKKEEGDSWIVCLIKDAITGVKTWLGNMFKFDSASSVLASAFNVVYFLPNIIYKGLTLVGEWLLKLFGFDSAAEKVANAGNFTLGGLVMGAVNAIVCWFTELLSWGETDAGDWSLSKMVGEAIDSIFAWFKGLINIDWGALMDNLVPDWAKKILPGFGPTSKAEAAAEAAEEAAKELREQKMRIKIQKAKDDNELRNRSVRADKLAKEIAKVEEEKAQSQLWIKTEGQEGIQRGKGTIWDTDEKEMVTESNAKLQELLAAQAKAKEADHKFKEAVTKKSEEDTKAVQAAQKPVGSVADVAAAKPMAAGELAKRLTPDMAKKMTVDQLRKEIRKRKESGGDTSLLVLALRNAIEAKRKKSRKERNDVALAERDAVMFDDPAAGMEAMTASSAAGDRILAAAAASLENKRRQEEAAVLSRAAGSGNVTYTDARKSSSVTATGSTGQGSIRNNKYADMNKKVG